MIHIQINMLETLRKKLCSKMLKQKVGVAPSKISTLLFSPQVCPVPKDIFKSHSILTGKVASTETFETHLAYAWHRIERHLSTLCFHLRILLVWGSRTLGFWLEWGPKLKPFTTINCDFRTAPHGGVMFAFKMVKNTWIYMYHFMLSSCRYRGRNLIKNEPMV